MMGNRSGVILLAVMLLLLPAASAGQNAKKFFKAGQELVENSKYEDAVTQFTSAIGMEPSNPVYYNARAEVYLKLKKYAEARSDLEKAVVFNPKDADLLISLGAVCNRMKSFDEALKILNHATVMERRNTRVYPEKVISMIGLGMYDQALKVSDTAIMVKDTPMDYYYRGVIYRQLNNDAMARKEFEKSISKDKVLAAPRLALAELLIPTDIKTAMAQCTEVLKKDDRNTDAYLVRSKVYMKMLEYPSAINDISKNILIEPDNPVFYFERGRCYQEFSQHTNAINDFSKYISLRSDDPEAYFARARSYEEIMNFDKAIADYTRITALSEFDMKARKRLKEAEVRLYELNRETVAPEISIVSPTPVNDTIKMKGDKVSVLISGKLKDKSKIKSFTINGEPVAMAEKNGEYDFLSDVNVGTGDRIVFEAVDDYDNKKELVLPVRKTEINPPLITLVAPYTTEDGKVMLDSPTPNIAIQGKIADESPIRSITIGDISASYRRDELNPRFTAVVDITNMSKFTVVAEDIYGNRKETEYVLDREGAELASSNPMGKTWVIFVENSSYESFPSLDGPIKDISSIQRALANYQVNNVIHKKDMTKSEMDRYFNIELRDLVRKNQVKSLLVWYAGHGKYINEIGYWIPVDAKRDDEFTYYNINALKAGLQGYGEGLVHTLVISDACESGAGFYTAMRSAAEAPTCDNPIFTGAKSAQVFSSAGYELAADNSKFSATFANTLLSNRNACIPIETIVKSVIDAVRDDKGQKPKFGRIQGLDDMTGTFFFIAK